MAHRTDRKAEWSRRSNGSCIWGLISLLKFHRSNSSRRLTNPSQKDGQNLGHGKRRRKMNLVANFKWKPSDPNKAKRILAKESGSSRTKGKNENICYLSKTCSEVRKLENLSSVPDLNCTQENSACNSSCNRRPNDQKLPMLSENEKYIFQEPLGKTPSHKNIVSILKELNSDKDQEFHVDSMASFHISTKRQSQCRMHDFSDQCSREQVKDYFISQEELDGFLRRSARHEFSNEFADNKEIRKSGELRHFLEVLNSNNLIRKVLQDPNSHAFKYVQNHSDHIGHKPQIDQSCKIIQKSELLPGESGRSRKCTVPSNNEQNQPRCVGEGLLIAKSSKEEDSQGPKSIQVQKTHHGTSGTPNHRNFGVPLYSAPNLKFDKDKKLTSHFSIQQMIERLDNLFGNNRKGRHVAAKGAVHKISSASVNIIEHPQLGVALEDMDAIKKEFRSKTIKTRYNPVKEVGTKSKDNHAAVFHRRKKKSRDLQMEAKRPLGEILYGADYKNKLEKRPQSLRKLLTFPQLDQKYPLEDPLLLSKSMNSKLLEGSKQETDLDLPQSSEHKLQTIQERDTDPDTVINQMQKSSSVINITASKGTIKVDSEDKHERSVTLQAISKNKNHRHTEEATAHVSSQEEYSQSPANIGMPVPLPIHNDEAAMGPSRKPQRPCPGSLVETFFLARNKIQPNQVCLEEHISSGPQLRNSNMCVNNDSFKLGYLKALLQASGLCNSGTVDGSQSPTQLLELSLYDEVETPFEEIPDDLKLFFDCMNEALGEIYKQSSTFMPWVSYLRPNLLPFPSKEHLIQEVWKGLNGIFVLALPETLEQIVAKDAKCGDWEDIRNEAQWIVCQVEHLIMECLLDETVFEFEK